jgi:hypothetical protein
MQRNRWLILLILSGLIAAGLASRTWGASLPPRLALYAGDTLWAAVAYFGIALLVPRLGLLQVAGLALAVSFGVEVSQLYHAPWIASIRATRPGGWILGRGFLWTDLVCYSAGIALAAGLDWMVHARMNSRR